MPNHLKFMLVLLPGLCLQPLLNSWARGAELEVHNEVVCYVNTDKISKVDVEGRMISEGGDVVIRLFMRREHQKSSGTWNARARKEFDELYTPLFLDELKESIKERLMFQEAIETDISINPKELEKAIQFQTHKLQNAGMFMKKGYRPHEIRKAIKDRMLIKTFRSQLVNILDLPNRPKVLAYYKKNLDRYQRKAAVKVRIIKIDRFYHDDEGRLQIKEGSEKLAKNLRTEIVDLEADFAEVAKDHSDDDEKIKEQGGLILGKDGDEFIIPEEASRHLAIGLRRLKVGQISKVFRFGDNSWAILKLEAVRPAGPRPLTLKLYKEIYDGIVESTIRKNEADWFKKAVKKSLIKDSRRRALPLRFFFPEEEGIKGTASGKSKTAE